MQFSRWVVAAFLLTLAATPGLAADPLGTAGPIRVFGGGPCKAVTAIMSGECDPPAVDSAMPLDQRGQARLERARQLIAIPRIAEAIKEMDLAVAEDPRNVAALILRARLKMPGDHDATSRDINAALQIDPDSADALANRALLTMAEDFNGAFKDVNRSIALDPKNADSFWVRATILRQAQSFEEAERDLTMALTLEPGDLRCLLSRAQVRMQLANTKGAEDDATAVLALDRHDFVARQLRAVVRVNEGDYLGALDDLNEVLGAPGERTTFSPDRSHRLALYVQRTLVLTKVGRPEDARRDLDTVVSQGGIRAVLQMQLYLRHHGFPDVKIDGRPSDQFNDALRACFIDNACGPNMTISG